MSDYSFTMFETPIGSCGVVWGPRGINGVQLPMSSEEKTRSRILQRHGNISEASPPAEVRRAIEGMVELIALVDTTGAVVQVEIIGGSRQALLEQAASSAVLQCRYRPYRIRDDIEPVWAYFRITFRLY